jgi:hypothetical protein
MPMLLLILGFTGAALVAVLDPHTVNWGLYAGPLLAGFVGVFWHRRRLHAAASQDDHVHGSLATLTRSLDRICAGLDVLLGGPDALPVHAARFEIDRRFRADLEAFADAREAMPHAFGVQAYADIMSAFAAGERYLNRVWSASADGYEDEVQAYLERAQLQFHEARELLAAQAARRAAGRPATA